VSAIPRTGGLAVALARLGFASSTDAVRHLESARLGEEGMARIARACANAADPDLAVAQVCRWIAMSGHVPSQTGAERLAAVLGLSTSMGAFLARRPEQAKVVLDKRIASRMRRRTALVTEAAKAVASGEDPMTALRVWKRREMLRIAARDLIGEASVEDAGAEIAHLAEACLSAALGAVRASVEAPPGARFCVIAMGKLGGEELNYSSDVDVIFVHDGGDGAVPWAAKTGEHLIRMLAATTEDGQVFRVDTTLRPEGRSGALSRSLAGYKAYYEKWAQPWEFQALLKARPVAGDADLGERFMAMIEPFVFPERLEPEALREIRELKSRAERAIAAQGIADREVKRGPGGIRDIEFAVQLLQLVHGRRDVGLRTPNTLHGLAELAHRAYVGDQDADELTEAYRFLRKVEHRLQLAQERQTHTVPDDDRARLRLARAMGYRDTPERTALASFDADWRGTQKIVRRIHEKLFYRPLLERFAQAPALAPDAAQERLNALGFRSPGRALKFLSDLTAGLSRRAKLMRTMLPVMLDWMSDSPNPDLAVSSFRDVALTIGGNPAALGVLRDAPPVVELLCRVLGTSRIAGEYLQHVPEFVAEMADPKALARRPKREYVREALEHVEWRGEPAERDAALRRLKRRGVLRLMCRDLAGATPVEEIGRELTALAEGAVRAALASLEDEHPAPPGARFCVIGLGRLGGEELNYASDLDVLYVFDGPDENASQRWATRIGEGLIHRLAASTEEGQVFRVDTSLRPEGKGGALVRSLAGYRAYYERWARPWEFMALTKARPVAGDPTLAQQFADLIAPWVWRAQLAEEAVHEIRTIKARVERERLGPREDPKRQIKVGEGGLIDVEFTVQLLQLRHGHSVPALRTTSTIAAIAAAAEAGLLDLERARWLADAFRFLNRVRNRLYLVRGRASDALPVEADELEVLARALGYPSPAARNAFAEEYRRTTRRARQVCEDVFYGGRL